MIVLDSCAAYEMVIGSEIGLALRSLMANNEEVVSCELMRAELASVFRKLARLQKVDTQTVEKRFSMALGLVDKFYQLEPLQIEALNESIRLDHSAYDIFYFVLARRLGATLFTTDKKLMRLCEKHGVNCVAEADI